MNPVFLILEDDEIKGYFETESDAIDTCENHNTLYPHSRWEYKAVYKLKKSIEPIEYEYTYDFVFFYICDKWMCISNLTQCKSRAVTQVEASIHIHPTQSDNVFVVTVVTGSSNVCNVQSQAERDFCEYVETRR